MSAKPRILVIFGTRPEAIKLFPVIAALKSRGDLDVRVCVTAQHRGLLDQVLSIAGLVPDIDLDLMEAGAFANELSVISDNLGIDVWEVIRQANRHPRVNILSPGPGVGGHCIAVDPWFIAHSDPDNARMIRTAREVNDAKVGYTIGRAEALIESMPGVPVARLGLACKANIDDFRESPAMKVASHLAHRFGDRVRIVEPYADALPPAFDDSGATLIDVDAAIEDCPIFIVLVDHEIFKSIPLDERADKRVYDTRGIWPDQPIAEQRPVSIKLAS